MSHGKEDDLRDKAEVENHWNFKKTLYIDKKNFITLRVTKFAFENAIAIIENLTQKKWIVSQVILFRFMNVEFH
jgi:hypothetical protein